MQSGSPGYDTIYIANVPSYAAAAWYFNKVQNKPPDVATWVQQARDFASGPVRAGVVPGGSAAGGATRFGRKGDEPADRPQRGVHQGSKSAGIADAIPEGSDAGRPATRWGVMTCASRESMWMRRERIPATTRRIRGSRARLSRRFNDYLERELKYETTDTYRPSAGIDRAVGMETQACW